MIIGNFASNRVKMMKKYKWPYPKASGAIALASVMRRPPGVAL